MTFLTSAAKARRRLLFAAFATALGFVGCGPSPQVEQGRLLFVGDRALDASIGGQDLPLPSIASRCVNCHVAADSNSAAPPASAASGSQAFGGPLSAQRLTSELSRRGGPPSRFDEAAFCKLLRTGIDPSAIIVTQNMPRYRLSDADCHALWTYLNQTHHEARPASS